MGRGHTENSLSSAPPPACSWSIPGVFPAHRRLLRSLSGETHCPTLVFPRRPWKSFLWARFPGQAQLWGYQNPTAWLKKTNQGANNSFVTYVTLLISSLGVVVGAHTLLCPVEKLLAAPMERGLWTARGLLLLTPAPPSSGCPGLGLWRPLDVRVTPCNPDTARCGTAAGPLCVPPGRARAKHSLGRTRNQRESQEEAG